MMLPKTFHFRKDRTRESQPQTMSEGGKREEEVGDVHSQEFDIDPEAKKRVEDEPCARFVFVFVFTCQVELYSHASVVIRFQKEKNPPPLVNDCIVILGFLLLIQGLTSL